MAPLQRIAVLKVMIDIMGLARECSKVEQNRDRDIAAMEKIIASLPQDQECTVSEIGQRDASGNQTDQSCKRPFLPRQIVTEFRYGI